MGKEAARPRVQGVFLPSPKLSFRKGWMLSSREVHNVRGGCCWQEDEDRETGTSELFPRREKKTWGKRKGWRNPYMIVLHY